MCIIICLEYVQFNSNYTDLSSEKLRRKKKINVQIRDHDSLDKVTLCRGHLTHSNQGIKSVGRKIQAFLLCTLLILCDIAAQYRDFYIHLCYNKNEF